MNRLASFGSQTKKELRSPAVVIGVATIVVEVLLFILNRTLPEDQPGGAIRDAISWVAGAAPWLIPALLVSATTAWLISRLRSVSGELRTAKTDSEAWREKATELERTVARLESTQPQATLKQPKYSWLKGWDEGQGELLIRNSELEEFHERAAESLRQQHLEARFSGFAIFADPFLDESLIPGWRKVRISMNFWAPAATREYTFSFDEYDSMLQVGPGSLPKRPVDTFLNLPWRSQPQWCELVRVCAIRAGKLVHHPNAGVFVAAYQHDSITVWRMTINDFGAGRSLRFVATSPQDVRIDD